ncbi:MAG TPA: hypothetical protein VK427_05250, partial [Kofleriaceae bacterium]|nr:hypothetical protein [Kofleriaceae bacterium]
MRCPLLLCVLAACESKPQVPAPKPAVGSDAGKPVECTDLPFAATTPVPEASGAAWLDIDGKPALLVISD